MLTLAVNVWISKWWLSSWSINADIERKNWWTNESVNADISGECMNHLIQTLKAWTNDLVNADIKRKNWWFSNWSVNDDLVIDKSAMNQLMV